MKTVLKIAAATAALAFTMPASAAVVACSTGPVIDLVNDGCTASGNDDLASVEAAFAAATGVNVSTLELSLYGKSDAANAGSLFTFPPDGDPHNDFTTDWTVIDGTLIKYVTIKASNSFKLYELPGAGASSSGLLDFSTLGIPYKNNPHDISHLSFWTVPTTPVPEPATWAMMMIGFGAIGGALRRRQRQSVRVSFG